jgi:hypothetical protein
MIAAQWIIVRKGDVVRVQFAAVGRIFVVLDDYFPVKIIHY